MKRILMAIMAVAVAVTFSAPAFAEDAPKDNKDKKTETAKPKEDKKSEKSEKTDKK